MEDCNIFLNTKNELTEKEIHLILSLCEELFPAPNLAVITQANNVKELLINSYLDKEVLKVFERNKYGIEYRSGTEKPAVRIMKPDRDVLIVIPLINGDEYQLAKKIALLLVERLDLTKLGIPPVAFSSFQKKYRKNKRTTDFPGLYWLQYYDAEEFKKQGGKAILGNPYIDAQLIKDGIFIEVGKSPYDFQTPEGETLMINANAAMPTVIKQEI